ncbi:Thioesterase superfamily [Venturia nashicola]|uniref:Thioesterase superfamily n=1 Tax=Venturia nashicola TaxID=86259 RepID=A0A4Z1NWF6_9PEZI|nr:Thioesterase superfamily [Venturia nashicola]
MVVHHPQTHLQHLKVNEYRIPHEILLELRKQEWCLETLNNPSYLPLTSHSRTPPPHLKGRYSLFSKTLSTKDTIPIWQGFYKSFVSEEDPDEVRILLALGPGMDGHLNTVHGGISAVILDQAMGTMAEMHQEPGKAIFTAYLHTEFKKPVPTPSVCLIRATFDAKRSAGRKFYVNATLENGKGVVYTTAECLYLEQKREHGPKI